MTEEDAIPKVSTSTVERQGPVPTPVQCRMARAALGWSADRLAEEASVGRTTVLRYEQGRLRPYADTLDRMRRALEAGGVRFQQQGNNVGVFCPDPLED